MDSPTNKQINMCKVIGSPPVQDRLHSVKMHSHTEHARVQPGQADTRSHCPTRHVQDSDRDFRNHEQISIKHEYPNTEFRKT